eukprot:TRINITY_DN3335_c0_g2_i4.p1 TRINITY_DN3335_c0_g2~~TRINITY_DN3335_c0_g2_i4.p1  ORF type:complete len:268 (+),score=56.95 TRINITY_DN3335_c0_g2_i4:690-1493(+)
MQAMPADLLLSIAAVHLIEVGKVGNGGASAEDLAPLGPEAHEAMLASELVLAALGRSGTPIAVPTSHLVFLQQLRLLVELFEIESSLVRELSQAGVEAAGRLLVRREGRASVECRVSCNLIPRHLIQMPKSFADLYSEKLVNSTQECKARAAVCLVCGTVVAPKHSPDPSSGCSHHLNTCSGGVGIFFLIQECRVLLMRRGKAAYYLTLYVDRFGERLKGSSQRGRPLFLDSKQLDQLNQLWLSNQVGTKVVAIRCSADRVIRENYY